jgi:hypothetical protein
MLAAFLLVNFGVMDGQKERRGERKEEDVEILARRRAGCRDAPFHSIHCVPVFCNFREFAGIRLWEGDTCLSAQQLGLTPTTSLFRQDRF